MAGTSGGGAECGGGNKHVFPPISSSQWSRQANKQNEEDAEMKRLFSPLQRLNGSISAAKKIRENNKIPPTEIKKKKIDSLQRDKKGKKKFFLYFFRFEIFLVEMRRYDYSSSRKALMRLCTPASPFSSLFIFFFLSLSLYLSLSSSLSISFVRFHFLFPFLVVVATGALVLFPYVFPLMKNYIGIESDSFTR